jgi:ribosome maturation factor RimP
MIEKETVKAYLSEILGGTDIFLVDVRVDKSNRIQVHVDKKDGIAIDDCVQVSRGLEGKFDREEEDFSLEVSSPGLDAPFRVAEQYDKNTGKMVSVQCNDGSKFVGLLKEVGDKRIMLELPADKKGGEPRQQEIDMTEIQSTRIHIQFKANNII